MTYYAINKQGLIIGKCVAHFKYEAKAKFDLLLPFGGFKILTGY